LIAIKQRRGTDNMASLLNLCEKSEARDSVRESLREGNSVTDTAIIVPPGIDAETSHTPFSWSAAIAGALAATAVTLIVAALGSGIGLSFASPYGSGPSATTMTIAAAVWLVMAQTMGRAIAR
jgi:hypothetical protein